MDLVFEQADTFDTDMEMKTGQYMDYLEEHIGGVVLAYRKYFYPLINDKTIRVGKYSNEDFINAIKANITSIEKHDLSKYNDLEFYPYRRHFYPTIKEENAEQEQKIAWEEEYDKAWQHHYQNNKHHIEFWYDWQNGITKDMDLASIIEMICDWISMSYITDSPIRDWWDSSESDKERSMMTPETIAIVNQIFDIITK